MLGPDAARDWISMKRPNSTFPASFPTTDRPAPGIAPSAVGPRLLFTGHSHLGALAQAWTARRKAGRAGDLNVSMVRLGHQKFGPEFEVEAGTRRLTEGLIRRLKHVVRRDRPDAIVAILMGNEYNSLAMVRHPRPFDLIPRTDGMDPDLPGIPEAMMVAQLAELAAQNALMIWKALAEDASCPIYLLPPPPPIASSAHIRSHPGQFGALVAKHGLNPAPLRRRMWLLYCQGLAQAVSGHPGTVFFDLPEDLFDGGFLAEPHWQGDPTHGNALYGEALLTRIEARLVADGVLTGDAASGASR